MIGTDVDEAPVQIQVIDAIGVGPGNGWMRKVMPIDLFRLLHFSPLPAFVVEVTDQLFLLGVDGNDRIFRSHRPANFVVDVPELLVSVGMVVTLFGLPVALKAVIHGPK